MKMLGMIICVCAIAVPAKSRSAIAEFTVIAKDFAFAPARLEVKQNDIVRITFRAVDIPHTFTIDEYRISKRSAIGQTIVFEFCADRAGTFPIYCNLTADDRCRRMKGTLVVTP